MPGTLMRVPSPSNDGRVKIPEPMCGIIIGLEALDRFVCRFTHLRVIESRERDSIVCIPCVITHARFVSGR